MEKLERIWELLELFFGGLMRGFERTITSISNDQTDHFFNPADWERRQDSAGRWGWERRDAPESERWWRHSTFEELPEPIKL